MKKRNAKSLYIDGYDPTKVILSKEEQAFEDNMEVNDYVERVSKSERMNIRLSHADLIALQQLAARLGIPYQTLVGSVIHRYVTQQLVDVDEVKKVLNMQAKEKKRA